MFYFAVRYVHSYFASISLGKRELVDLLLFCSDVMSLLSFFDSSSRCRGLSVVCDCGISGRNHFKIGYIWFLYM